MNTTSNHRDEMPSNKVAPSSQNGHSTGGLESSRGTELNAQLVQENAKLAQENAQLMRERNLLRTLLDNIPDRIYFKDTQLRFVQCNQAVARRVGVEAPEQVIGKTDFDFYPLEKAEEFRQDEQKLLKAGQPLADKTEQVTETNGETRWASVTKVPLWDDGGKVIGLVGISRDVTELKRTEEALRQAHDELEKQVDKRTTELSQERLLLRTLIDNLPDYVYAKDAEGQFVIANMAVARQLGFSSPNDVIGKSDFDLFPQELAARYRAEELKMMQSGQVLCDHEGPTVDKSKEEINRWVSTTKVILRDAQGKVTGFIGLGQDITKRKQVEESLNRERVLLRTLIDNLPDCIYAKDAAGRKTMANPADLKNLRCKTEAEAIGKSDFDFFPPDIAEKFWADDQKVIQGQPVIDREEYFLNDEGEKRWLLTSKLPLRDQNGKIVGLMGIGRDITARKQAEGSLDRERILLRTLIDNLPDHIYAKDQQGHFVLNNAAHAKAFGITPQELMGKSDFDFFPPELAKQFYNDERKIIETGTPVINQEQYKCNRGDPSGIKQWSVTTKVIWRDDQNAVLGTVGITRDIHEMKLAQEALRLNEGKLRQFTTQLERSNRELQDFAYVASHDLQEPLRKIVVFGERLKEKSSESMGTDGLDYLDRMQRAAARMQILINDLLTFSRVTSKAQPFAPVNLAEVASGVVDDLEGRIELVKGRVEVGALPVIDAEALQMRQLLQNLIGNALKFRRPEEPPVVKVEAQIIPDPGAPKKKLCRLTVSDNCIGFDEKYLDRIFNVFQRLHTRNEYEGTGMGLAIVRKIALYHGGDITAKSKLGQGATFILTIPVAHPKEAQDENE